MTNTPTAWTWGQSVATTGTGPTATVEIDVRVPGHREPEPVVVPLADARVLHAMLGDAIREMSPGGEAAVIEAATETPAQLLRRAAAKLRQDAEAARRFVPEPWSITEDRVIRAANDDIVADRSSCRPGDDADLPFIAAMHPGVGLALAELLDVEANVADDMRRQSPALTDGELAAWVHGPLAIARVLLGEVTS